MQLLQWCNSVVEINAAIRRGLRSDDNCHMDSSVVVTSPYAAYEVYTPINSNCEKKFELLKLLSIKFKKEKEPTGFRF